MKSSSCRSISAAIISTLLWSSFASAEDHRVLFDFSGQSPLASWTGAGVEKQCVDSPFEGGGKAMALTFPAYSKDNGGSYWDNEHQCTVQTSPQIVLTAKRVWPKEYAAYRVLTFKVKNAGDIPCTLIVRMETSDTRTDLLGKVEVKAGQIKTIELDLRRTLDMKFVLSEDAPLHLSILPAAKPVRLVLDDIRVSNGIDYLTRSIRHRIKAERDKAEGQLRVAGQLDRWSAQLGTISAAYLKTRDLAGAFKQLDDLEERVKWFGRDDSSLKYALGKLASGANPGYLVGSLTGMTKVMRYAMPRPVRLNEPIRLDMARNEMEHAQVVVLPLGADLRNLRWSARDLVGPHGATLPVQVRVVGYIRTKGVTSFWFMYPFRNDLIGLWPEPLLDYPAAVDVPYDEVQPLWITVRTATGTPAGEYKGVLRLETDRYGSKEVPLEVRVRPFELPVTPSLRTATVYDESEVKRVYGKAFNDDLKWKFRRFVLSHRLNVDNFFHPFTDLSVDELKELKKLGQNYITVGNIWEPEAAFMERRIAAIGAFYPKVKAAGLGRRDQCCLFGLDEFHPENMGRAKEAVERLKELFPDVPFMTTSLIPHFARGTPWERSFDIWVPHFAYGVSYANQLSEIPAVRKSGREVWWYTCCTEAFMVEYPGLEPRMIMGVLTWKYRPDGYLYYSNNRWGGNDHPMADAPICGWNSGPCGNQSGCGIFFYPGKLGPLSSVRFENFTDGLEDYEYFVLLDRLVAQARRRPLPAAQKAAVDRCEKILSIPPELARGVLDYSQRPEDLVAYRKGLADAIVKIQEITARFQKGNTQ